MDFCEISESVKGHVANNDLKNAISELSDFLSNISEDNIPSTSDQLKDVILLYQRINSLYSDQIKGIISDAERVKSEREICNSILLLLEIIEDKILYSNNSSKSHNVVLFGYFYFKEDGLEHILIFPDNDKIDYVSPSNPIFKFPIVYDYNPNKISLEDATNSAVEQSFENLKVDFGNFRRAGFWHPVYHQMYEIDLKKDGRNFIRTPKLQPFILIKIELQNKFVAKNGMWVKKNIVTKQWYQYDSYELSQFPKTVKVNLFKKFKSYKLNNEYGFNLLECVDVLIFHLDENNFPHFLMLKREESAVSSGWEYPKGRLYYHETELEGALRIVSNETSIRSENIEYCYYLGWQTADVNLHGKEWDTIRVHGLVFHYHGIFSDIAPSDKVHTGYRWMELNLAQDMSWMKDYPKEFFNRWKKNEEKILRAINEK